MIKQECLVIPDEILLMNIKNLEAEIILCPAGAYFRESVPSKSIEIESWTAVKFLK